MYLTSTTTIMVEIKERVSAVESGGLVARLQVEFDADGRLMGTDHSDCEMPEWDAVKVSFLSEVPASELPPIDHLTKGFCKWLGQMQRPNYPKVLKDENPNRSDA